jgi:hypothetical protein
VQIRMARQNTGDLRRKKYRRSTMEMRANYNARPWDGERKAAGAGTMENNGKNNA